jgi:hypothetical protein
MILLLVELGGRPSSVHMTNDPTSVNALNLNSATPAHPFEDLTQYFSDDQKNERRLVRERFHG